MSYKATNWAYEMQIVGPKKMLLVALADMADESATCFPSQDRLSGMTGLSRRTVQRAVERLEKLGLVDRFRRNDARGHRSSDRYRLRLDVTVTETLGVTEPTRQRANKAESQQGRESIPKRHSDAVTISEPLTTDLESVQVSETPITSEVGKPTVRRDVDELLDLLDSLIVANGAKKPERTKRNLDAARLLLDRDGHTVAEVEGCIRWCQAHEFWRSNILSMSKLREKYDQMALQARSRAPNRQPTRDERNLAVVKHFAQMESNGLEIRA